MLQDFLPIILLGLVHGLEPGHGWPVAAYYSLKRKNTLFYGFLTSLIISFFHFFSSIVVVVAFLFFSDLFNFSSLPFIKYVVFLLLLFLALKAWFHKETDHEQKKAKSLKELAYYAFIIGFVHEEEFAILAFCINGADCINLMIVYALAVTASLITITIISIKSYGLIKNKIVKHEKYLHKIFAIVLFLIALSYLIRF